MRINTMSVLVLATGLAGCVTNGPPTRSVSDLTSKDTLNLCKIALTEPDEAYRVAAGRLATRRGATLEKCQQLIATDGAIMTGIAVVGVGVAAGAAAPGVYGGYSGRPANRTYTGNCATPDDRDAAGHRCGLRSAASRPGGYDGYGGYD